MSIFKFVFNLCRTWGTWTSAVRGACLKKVRSVMSQNPVLENLSERFVSWVRIKAPWRPAIRMKQNSRRSNRICFDLLHFTAIICTIYKTAERKVDLTNITSNLINWLWDFFSPLQCQSNRKCFKGPQNVLKSVSIGITPMSHFKHGTTFKCVTEKQSKGWEANENTLICYCFETFWSLSKAL